MADAHIRIILPDGSYRPKSFARKSRHPDTIHPAFLQHLKSWTFVIYVTRKAQFNAAHRLNNPGKPEEWNRRAYGKCNLPNWHGHNYTIEVTVAGDPDPETGFVIDLSRLKEIIEERIVDICDHRNLNLDVPFLDGVIPSTENLVRAFYHQLREPVERVVADGAILYSVKLYETERNFAEYRIDQS